MIRQLIFDLFISHSEKSEKKVPKRGDSVKPNNEKGYTLVSVLLVILLLVILGGAYMVIMSAEARQSIIHSDRVQAYYYARSGAEAASNWLIANHSSFFEQDTNRKFYGDLVEGLSADNPGDPEIEVTINKPNGNNVLIHSTGNFRGRDQSVSLMMRKLDFFDRAIFTYADLDVNHVLIYIEGDVESKGQIFAQLDEDGNILNIDGEVIEYSDREYEPPVMKENLPSGGVLNVGNHKVTLGIRDDDISANNDGTYIPPEDVDPDNIEEIEKHFSKIQVAVHGMLYIDSGNKGDETYIIVDEIEVKGELRIKGEGTVFLYIVDGGQLITPGNESGDFIVLLGDEANLDIRTPGTSFHGVVYGPTATISMGANPGGGQETPDWVSSVVGAIIVNEITDDSKVWSLQYAEYDFDENLLEKYIPRKPVRVYWQ